MTDNLGERMHAAGRQLQEYENMHVLSINLHYLENTGVDCHPCKVMQTMK